MLYLYSIKNFLILSMFHFLTSKHIDKRLKIIKISTSVFMILGLLMSFNVWILNHEFPIIKVSSWMPEFSQNATSILLFTIFLLLIVSIFKQKKIFYLGILILTMLLLTQDYMRWQPWEYMYGLMFIAFLFDTKKNTHKTFFILKVVLSGAYFWAGVHKLNPYFINTFPLDLANQIIHIFSVENTGFVYKLRYLGYLVPIIEIGIGIGLWMTKYRKLSVFVAIITHITILIFQAPGGVHYFGVVYPWNIAMIIFVWFLFYQASENLSVQNIKKSGLSLVIILFVWLLPALNIFGLWHNYASFKLYTGNDKYLFAVVNQADLNTTLSHLKNHTFKPYPEMVAQFDIKSDQSMVSFYNWTINDLSLPLNLNNTSITQLLQYMHTFDAKLKAPISFLIYKNGRYQELKENDYPN
jgi:hypothetical protein